VNPKELTIEKVQEILRDQQYVCDRSLATVVYLSLVMGKPLLLEGEAGVGKTEIAKVLSKVLDAKLIRLQCYEGLDANTALYEWNYP
jgi:MoxR-like ATPase